MISGETELEMVERHIREAERHVARQHEIVQALSERSQPTALAEQLLGEFERALLDHRKHLARLTARNSRQGQPKP